MDESLLRGQTWPSSYEACLLSRTRKKARMVRCSFKVELGIQLTTRSTCYKELTFMNTATSYLPDMRVAIRISLETKRALEMSKTRIRVQTSKNASFQVA